MTGPDIDALATAFAKLGLDPDELRTVAAVLMCLSFANETSPTRRPGRPKKQRAIYCATLTLAAIEEMTGCRFDLPRSNNNTRPHRVETVLREIFATLDIDACAKSSLAAALAERERQRGRRPCRNTKRGIDAEAFFARRNKMLFGNDAEGRSTMSS